MDLKNKKVLLMGLGILGGGVATAKFLVEKGVDLTVTDLKTKEDLKLSLQKLEDLQNVKYVLGNHREQDFLENEIIVINPDVPAHNKFVEIAKNASKQIENELTLFYKFCPTRQIVAVTGTRGKTTTVNWIAHFLKETYRNVVLAGNSSENTFLGLLPQITSKSKVVLEVPSYQLELLGEMNPLFAPKVAVVTNIYQDHLNRHGTMEEYARTKANIFKNQTQNDFLILNEENQWTEFLLGEKPLAQVLYFVPNPNLPNLAASVLAAKTMGTSAEQIERATPTLPNIKWRQEKVYDNRELKIYNDTTATSPEATMIAIVKFGDDNLILIAGGTDRELDYTLWTKIVNEKINPKNLILLSGSATEKMKAQLGWRNYNEFDSLEECLKNALKRVSKEKAIILFSPGAKSFEKFKNEFDRGEKFNLLVKKLVTN